MSTGFYKPPFSGDIGSLISPARFLVYTFPASLLFLFCVYVEFGESKVRGVGIQPSLLKVLIQFIAFGTLALAVQLRRVLLIFDDDAFIDQDGILDNLLFYAGMSLICGVYVYLSILFKIHIFFFFYVFSILIVSFRASVRFLGWLDDGEDLSWIEISVLILNLICLLIIFLFAFKLFFLKI